MREIHKMLVPEIYENYLYLFGIEPPLYKREFGKKIKNLTICNFNHNSKNITVSSIPKKNWGKCFVNKISDFTPTNFKGTGSYKQVLKLHNQNDYFEMNEKLLDE
jgi:hypothetical protein